MQNTGKIAQKHAESGEAHSVFTKKYGEVDVNKYRGVFLRVGYAVILAILLLAFTAAPKQDDGGIEFSGYSEEIPLEPPVTAQPLPPPPPPPPPPEIEVVEDEEEIEEPIELFDQEPDDEPVDLPPPPPPPDPEPEAPTTPFRIVEDPPEFPGGLEALYKFIYDKIKYPPMARENNIDGTVHVQFVVRADGSVDAVEALRGPGGGLDEEAIRVVKLLPKWRPGKQRGQAVPVYYNLPIRFTLN